MAELRAGDRPDSLDVFLQDSHGHLDRDALVLAMDVVEINVVGLKLFERGFELFANVCLVISNGISFGTHLDAELRSDEDLVTKTGDCKHRRASR